MSYLTSEDDPAVLVKSCSHSGYALLTVAGDGVTSLTFIALSHNILHLTVLRLVHKYRLKHGPECHMCIVMTEARGLLS